MLSYASAIVSYSGARLKGTVIFLHRWMGVPCCLLFVLWFASGIGMMYWQYPMVSEADRLNHAAVLDGSKIQLSPADAYARFAADAPPPTQARLEIFDNRPAYKFGERAEQVIVYADNGQVQTEFPAGMTGRIAAAWIGQPASTAKEQEDVPQDQWTVSGEFRKLSPLRKYTWADGQEVYVSTVTGEVVQCTTRRARIGAYLGPIPHWLYFTPLRKHGPQWSTLVIWTSALATTVALLGLAAGLSMYSPSKRFNQAGAPAHLPYRGWKRWHAILGLIWGVLACTWSFSGMLSMDPFPRWQGALSNPIAEHYDKMLRGSAIDLAAFAAKPPSKVLAEAGNGIRRVELTSFAAEPVYLTFRAPNQSRVVPVRGEPAAEFDTPQMIATVSSAAWPFRLERTRMVIRYEPYYLDRRNALPLPVIFLQLNDPERSVFYIDPKTARIVQSYTNASRRNRWLYHGLHSIDLPALYRHRPAWDLVVLTLLLGGTLLCLSSVIMAWAVVKRKLHQRRQLPERQGS
jgi:hypothetical protein